MSKTSTEIAPLVFEKAELTTTGRLMISSIREGRHSICNAILRALNSGVTEFVYENDMRVGIDEQRLAINRLIQDPSNATKPFQISIVNVTSDLRTKDVTCVSFDGANGTEKAVILGLFGIR